MVFSYERFEKSPRKIPNYFDHVAKVEARDPQPGQNGAPAHFLPLRQRASRRFQDGSGTQDPLSVRDAQFGRRRRILRREFGEEGISSQSVESPPDIIADFHGDGRDEIRRAHV